MTGSFFTIVAPTTGTYKEKGSKFIAFAHPVSDIEQTKAILAGIKKQYFDASHHCYAWVLGPEKKQFRAFDDGEPTHSAGDPILGQIRSKNLTNVFVVVVRYFGGTKLGVSGLISAYRSAASAALNQAQILEEFITKRMTFGFVYAETTLVMSLVKEFDLKVVAQEFAETCRLTTDVHEQREGPLLDRVRTLVAQGHEIRIKP